MSIEIVYQHTQGQKIHEILLDVRSISWTGSAWIELYNVQPRGTYVLYFYTESEAEKAYAALLEGARRTGFVHILAEKMDFIDEDEEE